MYKAYSMHSKEGLLMEHPVYGSPFHFLPLGSAIMRAVLQPSGWIRQTGWISRRNRVNC
jgi:hypothetical protein